VSGEIGKIMYLLVHNVYFHFTLGMNNPESAINEKYMLITKFLLRKVKARCFEKCK